MGNGATMKAFIKSSVKLGAPCPAAHARARRHSTLSRALAAAGEAPIAVGRVHA